MEAQAQEHKEAINRAMLQLEEYLPAAVGISGSGHMDADRAITLLVLTERLNVLYQVVCGEPISTLIHTALTRVDDATTAYE